MTAEENETRVKGVTLLVDVVTKLPDTSFTRQSTRVINAFLITKLDTVDEVIPALKGLLRLSTMSTYTASDCKDATEQLLKFPMRAHVQSTRNVVFLLIDSFMTRHRAALQSLGKAFVKGYISLAENEKDPRNLLVAFALDRVILLEFEVSDFVEQFYDITFCYFPITFKAPPNDPYGVTGPDLVAALRNCLSASPLLGPPGMPLFIEKLNVGSPATKKDTLATVAVCLPVYGKAVAQTTADKLWDGLKIEIFQPVDVEVQDAALEVTKVLVQTCHPDESSLEGIGERILKTCLGHLDEPSTSQGQIAVKLVLALAKSSHHIANQVLQEVVPKLVALYETAPDTSVRTSVLAALAAILEAQEESSKLPGTPSPLEAYKDSILSLFVSAIKSTSTAEQGLKGISHLVRALSLETEELNFLIRNLTNVLLESRTTKDDLTPETVAVLRTLSTISPTAVEELALPPLFSLLPDKPPQQNEPEARANCILALVALEDLCLHPQLFSRLLVHLSTKVELLLLSSERANESVIAYAHALLKTVYTTLATKSLRGDVDIPKYMERFVPRLYYLFFDMLNKVGAEGLDGYQALISDAADIITLIVASSNVERQEPWVVSLFGAFDGKPSSITACHATLPDMPQFKPLEVNGNQAHDSLVALFTAGLIGLHPETPLPVSDVNELLASLLQVAVTSENAEKRKALAYALSSILNKHANDCSKFIDIALGSFWTTRVMNAEVTIEQRIGGLGLWGSAVRALIVRNHPASLRLARQLFALFDDAEMAIHAAKTLGQLPNLQESSLTKKYHSVVRLLHAQRLFNAVIAEILEGFSPAISSVKSNAYLIAVSNLVSSVPKSTSSQAFDKLFPLLLRGLELPDLDLRSNITESLVAVIEGENLTNGMDAITSHLGALIPRLLRNTRVDRHAHMSMRLKVNAIRFLGSLAEKMKREDVQPYRAEVLRELQSSLDDPSRAVRKEAVLARSKWYKCGSPPKSALEG